MMDPRKLRIRGHIISFFSNLSMTNWLILLNVIFFILVIVAVLISPMFFNYIALKPIDVVQGKSLDNAGPKSNHVWFATKGGFPHDQT